MWLPYCMGPRCSSHRRSRRSLLPRRTSSQPQQQPQSLLLLRLLLVQLLAGSPLLTGWQSAAAAATAAALTGSEKSGMDEVLQGGQVHIAVPLPVRPTDSGSETRQNVVPDEEGTTAPPTRQQQHQRLPPRTNPEAATAAATTEAAVAVIYALPNASRTGDAQLPTRPTPDDGRSTADDERPSGDGKNDDDGASSRAATSAEVAAAAAKLEQLQGLEKDERPAAAAASGTTLPLPPNHETWFGTAADLPLPIIIVASELGADETGDEDPGENATIAVRRLPDEPPTVEPSPATEQAEAHKEADEAAAVRGDAPESAGLATRQAASNSSVQQLTTMGWTGAEDSEIKQLTGGPTAPQLQAATPESAAAAYDDNDNDRQQQQPHDAVQATVKAATTERSDAAATERSDAVATERSDAAASVDPLTLIKAGYAQERSPGYGYTTLPAARTTAEPHFAPSPIATDSASHAAAATDRNKSAELPSLQGGSGERPTGTINRDLPSTQGTHSSHYPPRSTDFNDVSQASIVTAAAREAQLLSDATVTASDTAQASSSNSSSSSSDCCSSSAVPTMAATERSADVIAHNASAATKAAAAGTDQPLNASATVAIETTQSPRAKFSGSLRTVRLDGSSAAEANEMRATASTVGATDSSVGASGSSTTAKQLLSPLWPLLRGELASRHSTQQQQDETATQVEERGAATIASMSSDSNAVQVPAGCHNITGCNGSSKYILSGSDDSDRAISTASLSPKAGYGVVPGDRASTPRAGGGTGANDALDTASAWPPPVLSAGNSSSIHRLFVFLHTASESYHYLRGTTATGLENQPVGVAGDDSSSTGVSIKATGVSGSSSSTAAAATELTTTSVTPSKAPTYATSTRTAVSPSADLRHHHQSPHRGAAKLSASTSLPPSAPQPLPLPASTTRKSTRPPNAAGPTTASEPASGQLRSKVSANDDSLDVAAASTDESLQPLAQPGIQRLQAEVELRTTAKPSVTVASPPRADAEEHTSTLSSSHGAKGGAPADHGTELEASEVAHGDGVNGNGSDGGTTDAEHDGWTASGTVAGVAAGSAVAVCLVALGLAVWLVRRRSRRLRRHRRQRRHRGKGLGGVAASTGRRRGCRRHDEQDEREARYALHQTEHSLLEDLVMLELAKARSRGYVCDSDKVNYDEVFNLNAAISNQMITEL